MRYLLIGLLVTFLAIGLMAAVADTQHDLSSGSAATFNDAAVQATNTDQICVFCHTPHQPAGVTVLPLWTHTLSTQTYTEYTGYDIQATINNLDAGTGVTNLCLSCHDGSLGVGNLYKDPSSGVPDNFAAQIGVANDAYIGVDLSNDHPVNFAFDNALYLADGELNDPAGAAIQALLTSTDEMHCHSCHDVHDDTNGDFLVMSNAASALCLTCHAK